MSGSFDVRGLNLDPALTAAAMALAAIGAIMVGSASISLADRDMGEPLYFLGRHAVAVMLGCAAGLVALVIPLRVWLRLNGLLLLCAMALLTSVLIPGLGHTVNGSARWLALGPLTLQPSELARLCFVLYVAGYVVRQQKDLECSLLGFLKPMAVIGAACTLLLAEPDFGAAVVLTATTLGMLFIGGARLRDFLVAVVVAGGALASLALSSSYRVQRLMGFMDPWADPYASGFQLTQSLIAIGRGEWLGVGLGDSVQKLFYLPEAHTDFVFAVLAEELGLVGATLVIGLFGVLVYKALCLGPRAAAVGLPYQGLVSSGVGLALGLQASINIGVNLGLLPTKGLTLPLISYGRTSAVVTVVALALLMRAYHEVREAELRRPRPPSGDRRS
ncbi:MAG TPA: putative lipid II flippase FtsW [Gammaproteobacteria bacterium]|nr:putative lipid II flippase FtsW [Gammaproteobacteria bacterium]